MSNPKFKKGDLVECYRLASTAQRIASVTQLVCGGFEYIYGLEGYPTLAFRENELYLFMGNHLHIVVESRLEP